MRGYTRGIHGRKGVMIKQEKKINIRWEKRAALRKFKERKLAEV